MQWFKFYGGEYLSDPKMLALSPCERSCWITLLSYASMADDDGRVTHLTEERLMMSAGIDMMREEWNDTIGVLQKFASLDMVTLESNGRVTVTNWAKRQQSYLSGAERTKRWRERQKSDAPVTEQRHTSDARIEENRKEKNRNTSNEVGGIRNTGAKSMAELMDRYAPKGLPASKNKHPL